MSIGLPNTIIDNILTEVKNKAIKVFGVEWHPHNDMFKYNFNDIDCQSVPTKRIILSFASMFAFLINGVICSPFLILRKIILQELLTLQ